MIRTLIVDDEPLARQGLRHLLGAERDIEIVGESVDGGEAEEAIRAQLPDLVLLDIQMPDFDGFEVVRRVAGEHLPAVVFVTAHDEFALRAFEIHALDYLLKPVAPGRLRDAIERVRRELSLDERPGSQALARMIGGPSNDATSAPLRRIVVKERDRFLLVRDDEVAWIEAAGNYVELHARGQCFLLRSTLTDLARQLDPERFARIHRSTMVAIDCVREIIPDGRGDFVVRLDQGVELRMSRGFREQLLPRT
ncbi:MAG: response regulator transcription factor [Candidatus Eisenbacteria bacterium]|uniref:Response regulator transcription factor n=1 Tax=Eiseniibacteriota bacterium TaxID=2212470 RepID=A0A849SED2_UNCEI|nr:response regulator transcription factor [Candidatus Eisenbacteria bacterium]